MDFVSIDFETANHCIDSACSLGIVSVKKGKIEFEKEYFKELLNKFGFTVEIVQSGEDIIKRIKHGFKYDIIFTNNVYKGGEDGPMVLRHLRQIENFNTPIVIHTFSVDEKEHFLNYFKFDGFLKKQAEPKELKITLERIFEKNNEKGNNK